MLAKTDPCEKSPGVDAETVLQLEGGFAARDIDGNGRAAVIPVLTKGTNVARITATTQASGLGWIDAAGAGLNALRCMSGPFQVRLPFYRHRLTRRPLDNFVIV